MSEQDVVLQPAAGRARRTTRQREAVRAALAAHPSFVSAQELHHELRQAGESIGLATVYRALAQLAEDGEVDSMLAADGERYRACGMPTHHHHLVCRNCGRTIELQAPEVEAWSARIASEHGFSDISHNIEVFGICPRCTTAAKTA